MTWQAGLGKVRSGWAWHVAVRQAWLGWLVLAGLGLAVKASYGPDRIGKACCVTSRQFWNQRGDAVKAWLGRLVRVSRGLARPGLVCPGSAGLSFK